MARPRTDGNILPRYMHEKHGAFYLVRDGKWTRLGDTYPDAMAEYGVWMGGKSTTAPAGAPAVAGRLMMPDFLDRALPVICDGVKPKTVNAYKVAAKKLRVAYAAVTLQEFRPKHIYDIRRKLKNHPSTFNTMRTVLRLSITWAVEQELVEFNTIADVDQLNYNERDRYITDKEYADIYAKATDRMQVIMELCYRTGQRINDVLHIEHDHVVAGEITFRQTKTDKQLIVGGAAELADAVARAKAFDTGAVVRLDKPRYLFKGKRGWNALPYMTMHDEWIAACEAAGVKDAHVHDIRAKAATDIYLAHGGGNVGLLAAQSLMGHATAKMTWRYIRNRIPSKAQGPTRAPLRVVA